MMNGGTITTSPSNVTSWLHSTRNFSPLLGKSYHTHLYYTAQTSHRWSRYQQRPLSECERGERSFEVFEAQQLPTLRPSHKPPSRDKRLFD